MGIPGTIALYMSLARGTGEVLDRQVPADTDIYATFYLDPPLSQKQNLRGVIQQFPGVRTPEDLDSKIDQAMDTALRPEGLSFHNDVRPWLGTQVAAIGTVSDSSNFAILINSKDDGRARTALDALRTRGQSGRTWTSHDHGGVTVWEGASSTSRTPVVYALVEHTAVIGGSASLIDEVIDTAQGHHASLSSDSTYRDTLLRLPDQRLLTVYLNAHTLVGQLRKALGPLAGASGSQATRMFDQLDAYRSIGMAVTAQAHGVTADVTVLTDPGKLSASARAALTASQHINSTLGWVPVDSYGVLAISGLKTGAQSVLDSTGGAASGVVHDLGLDDPQGVLAHLTGDGAVEIGPGDGDAPVTGALLIGTDDAAVTQSFIERLLGLAGASPGEQRDESYRGVTIHVLGSGGTVFQPAYAISDGMAVIGSSPQAVRNVLDTHGGGRSSILTSQTFADSGAKDAKGSLLFLDLQGIASAVRTQLTGSTRSEYDQNVAPYLEPLRAFAIVGGDGSTDHQTVRFILTTR